LGVCVDAAARTAFEGGHEEGCAGGGFEDLDLALVPSTAIVKALYDVPEAVEDIPC
jgi:hypothetical protein